MLIDFTVEGRATKRGRYLVAPDTRLQIGASESPEFVGVGVLAGKENPAPALVHEHGPTQSFVPLYAVAQAIASTKVIPPDALVSAFVQTGSLAALKSAITKHEAAVTKAAAAVK